MRSIPALLLIVSALAVSSAAASAAPHLVVDLNTGPASDPVDIRLTPDSGLTLFHDGILYFVSSDPAHGQEVWRSDGTAAGTYRLTDVCAGRCDSRPDSLTFSGGHLFFAADDGVAGRELWASDGTPGSEHRVRDLCPGPCSSKPSNLVDAGDALFFLAVNGQSQQLWRTDSTTAGTALVATPCTVQSGQTFCASGLVKVGPSLFFSVDTGTQVALWRSDGTPAGTGPFQAPAGAALTWPSGLIPVGDSALFLTRDALWRTDGTVAGTVKIKPLSELLPPTVQLLGLQSQVWHGLVFIFIEFYNTAIVSDGTPEGTITIPGAASFFQGTTFAPLDNALLFISEENGSPTSLWRTQGTPATTERFFNLNVQSDFDYIFDIASLGDRALFRVSRGTAGTLEIWETDGTAAGTHQLQGVEPGTAAYDMIPAGSQVYYLRYAALWRTDGTPAGTSEVYDFDAGPGSSGPLAQAALGNLLVFSAQNNGQVPLLRSDGSAAGTLQLSDNALGTPGFTRIGNRLFFTVFNPDGIWWTDGTPAGTVRIPGTIASSETVGVLKNQLFFGAGDIKHPDVELWSTTGNTAGHPKAAQLKDINPFQDDTGFHHTCAPASSSPGPGVVITGGLLLFAADDGTTGRELWATDGTRGGTRLVRDINPGRSNVPPAPDCSSRTTTGLPSDPQGFVPFRQGALFTADDGVHGRELWWTDGTWKGTRRVVDLRPGAASSGPHDLTAFRGAVYFIASANGHGEALWRTDGTARGTVLVDDLKIGSVPSWASSLTVAGNQLFFAVYNETTGAELWVSQGTAASTRMVADLRPGPAGSAPQQLTAVGKVIVFAADDGEHGLEPWRSDGTAAGTRRLGDINPGPASSSPGPFTVAGPWVFTGAYDPVHGRELWAIPLAEVLQP